MTKANIAKAVRSITEANRSRLSGWASMYGATAEACRLDGVTPGTLAKAASDEGSYWQQAGFTKVSEETFRSYLTAAIITEAITPTDRLCTVVASGDLHKKVASAKAAGVKAATVKSWAESTAKAAKAASDSEAVAKVLRDAVETLKGKAEAAKAAKVTTVTGGSKGTDQTETKDAETVSAPETVALTAADHFRAAAGPIAAGIKALQGDHTADDEAAFRSLAMAVGAELKRLNALHAAA